MLVKRIVIQNFKLFKTEDIEPKGLNIFLGENQDNDSTNASGKSTLALEALMFALYGYTTAKLQDTITSGTNECKVTILVEIKNNILEITRSIPSRVVVILNDIEKEFATTTLAQKYINTVFGDIDFFRKFRTLDMQSGVNLLDLGNVSLKNLLMQFIQDYFSKIRKSLQEKKQNMNRFHISHKKANHTHYYSQWRIDTLDIKLNELKEELLTPRYNPIKEQKEYYSEYVTNKNIKNNLTSQLKDLQRSKCPTCGAELSKIKNETLVSEMQEEINLIVDRNEELENYLEALGEEVKERENWLQELHKEIYKYGQLKQNIEVAESLKEFKYTNKDIALYSNAIKVLDHYSAIYIENWLINLSVVINSLLKEINMAVKFNSTKEFMAVQDGTEEMKYSQLSTGQKRFLNIIFKLAILMQKNLEGIIIIDEGIDALDATNLKRLLKVFESLPFQVFLISQHEDIKSIQDVKYFRIVRKNNVSKVVA